MRRFTNAHLVLAALKAFVAFQAARYLHGLPAKAASHFDAAGHPNGWMSREMFVAMYAGITMFLAAMPWWMDALVRGLPVGMVNLPNREYWLAPGRREEAFRKLGGSLATFMLGTVGLLVAMTELAYRANLPGGSFNSSIAWMLMGAYAVVTAAWLVSLFRTFELSVPRP